MVGFVPAKMKRKDFEDVYDEFSEFSLSSPARKMRRLDAELPPIMEDGELGTPMPIYQLPKEEALANSSDLAEPMPSYSPNAERAIVLYKPVENPLILSPCQRDVSFHVSSDLIHGLKNHALKNKEKAAFSNDCLAVIPWVASQATVTASAFDSAESCVEQPMEAEETEATSMEVEGTEQAANVIPGEGFHWQQHCMTPQHLRSTSSPIMWSW